MLGHRRGRRQATTAAPPLLGWIDRSEARRSRTIQGQTMPKKDNMEVQFAFLALAFFAAFMAARSLTAYFKKK
jgi:hypothetical protein